MGDRSWYTYMRPSIMTDDDDDDDDVNGFPNPDAQNFRTTPPNLFSSSYSPLTAVKALAKPRISSNPFLQHPPTKTPPFQTLSTLPSDVERVVSPIRRATLATFSAQFPFPLEPAAMSVLEGADHDLVVVS